MTFLLIIATGLALFTSGYLLGHASGHIDGTRDAYDAVDRYLERRDRHH